MTDHFAGHEIAGHENDETKITGEKSKKKYSFNRDNTTMNCANF